MKIEMEKLTRSRKPGVLGSVPTTFVRDCRKGVYPSAVDVSSPTEV